MRSALPRSAFTSSASSPSSAASRAPKAIVASGAPPKALASLIIDGKRREVPVAEDEAILDAALRAGMDLPFACKGGMCSTCRAKLVEGEAQMEVNYSLEPWELKAGFILTCQARPVFGQGSWWITTTFERPSASTQNTSGLTP